MAARRSRPGPQNTRFCGYRVGDWSRAVSFFFIACRLLKPDGGRCFRSLRSDVRRQRIDRCSADKCFDVLYGDTIDPLDRFHAVECGVRRAGREKSDPSKVAKRPANKPKVAEVDLWAGGAEPREDVLWVSTGFFVRVIDMAVAL
jgi:hypothetical protein